MQTKLCENTVATANCLSLLFTVTSPCQSHAQLHLCNPSKGITASLNLEINVYIDQKPGDEARFPE